MTSLWPPKATRVVLGGGPGFAMHLPAQTPTAARPVVLVHGFRSTGSDWAALGERLSRTRDVWSPDLIAPLGTDGLAAVIELLERVRIAAGGGPVDVIGSSMGGYVSVAWAAAAPRSVATLTLFAPALVDLQGIWRVPGVTWLMSRPWVLEVAENKWESELATMTAAEAMVADTSNPLGVSEEWVQQQLDHSRAALKDPVNAERRHARQELLRSLMRLLRRPRDRARLLAGVTMPALWLHGDADRSVPFATSREVAKLLPDCTFEVLEGAGHVPQWECPELVADRFEEFVGV